MNYQRAHEDAAGSGAVASQKGRVAGAWLFVGIPFAYGVYELIKNVSLLFTG